MATATIESRQMGRPKKATGTVSIRMDEDAQQIARKAASMTGESLVEYISRVVREQAEKDFRAGAEQFLRESEHKNRRDRKGG